MGRHHGLLISALLSGGALATTATGCAGPTTPLGAIWSLHPEDASKVEWESPKPAQKTTGPSRGLASIFSLGADRKPEIQFDPPRQVLHGPRTLRVIIEDPRGVNENYGIQVRYRGQDV